MTHLRHFYWLWCAIVCYLAPLHYFSTWHSLSVLAFIRTLLTLTDFVIFLLVFFMDSILQSIFGGTSLQHLNFCISALWSQVLPLSFGNTSWQHLHYCICYLTLNCLEPLPLYVPLCFLFFPSWHQFFKFLVMQILVTMMGVDILLKQAMANKSHALKWWIAEWSEWTLTQDYEPSDQWNFWDQKRKDI